jgi:hypothetical protein
MNPRARAARIDDFDGFYHAAFPDHLNNAGLRGAVEHEWKSLLDSKTAVNLVVEDISRQPTVVLACTQGVFIQPTLARRLREGTAPWVNAHLAAPLDGHASAMLSEKELARANTAGTLSGVIARWHVVQSIEDGQAMVVREAMHQAFQRFSRGHNFQEIFVEATGEAARDEAIDSGFELVDDYGKYFQAPGNAPLPLPHARPFLLGITREKALSQRSSLIGYAFAYKPPRFFFSKAEREILQHALEGAGDRDLCVALRLSLDTIKSRWRAIFDRVRDVDNALLPQRGGEGRGVGKRAVLLKYLQGHMEELRPHAPASSTSSNPKTQRPQVLAKPPHTRPRRAAST